MPTPTATDAVPTGPAPAGPVTARPIILRIAAAILGGYAFCWGFMALSLAGLYGLGMEFHDAEHLGAIIAFLLWPAAFCWAFAARGLARVWLVLAGGGAVMAAAASLLQSWLLT